MLRTFDDRENFYQWDLDEKLIVADSTINEVHFCNNTQSRALVSKTYTENGLTVVNVPNILLQVPLDFKAYAYSNKHTVAEKYFKVCGRSKPANYIYTEPEIYTRVITLEKDINDINNAFEVKGVIVTDKDYTAALETVSKIDYNTLIELKGNFNYMFQDCTELTTVPLLDTEKCNSFENAFKNCKALTAVPLFNTSNSISLLGMFQNCTNLKAVPLFNTSKCTNFKYMFDGCSSLTAVPQLDTSAATNLTGMFEGCTALTTVPLLDTKNCTSFSYMFYKCSNLTTVPQFEIKNCTAFNYMFAGCSKLTTVPTLDLSGGNVRTVSYSSMFQDCTALTTIQAIKFTQNYSILYSYSNIFKGCTALKNINFIGEIIFSIDFSSSQQLTTESLLNIINALKEEKEKQNEEKELRKEGCSVETIHG